MNLHNQLQKTVEQLHNIEISKDRFEILSVLINYIQSKVAEGREVHLNFICTHNSRRSQFSQIWAQTAATYYNIAANCYSGGVEVTAFNERAVEAMRRAGFEIKTEHATNPVYRLSFSKEANPIVAFSKLYDDPTSPTKEFSSIMTCSHADENCPFIPGTEQRIPLRYDDPKEFDDTPLETSKYDERSMQIANEMFYVFSQIKK